MMMPAPPRVFNLLKAERNTAADTALLEALPHTDPAVQAAALDLLIERGHEPSLRRLITGYQGLDESLRTLVFDRADRLSGVLRCAIASDDEGERAAALGLIEAGRAESAFYLLAEALRAPCRTTRRRAAEAFARLVDRLVAERQETGSPANSSTNETGRTTEKRLADALSAAVSSWDVHREPQVAEAAAKLADLVDPAITRALQSGRGGLARILTNQLRPPLDAPLAGFALRGTAMPALQSAAARAIGATADQAFVDALVRRCWLLADPCVERGCRRIPDGPWVQSALDVLLDLDGPNVFSAVRLLFAVQMLPARRQEVSRELIGLGRADVKQAVIERLIVDRSEAATWTLTVLAARPGEPAAPLAVHELRRRTGALEPSDTARSADDEAFNAFWGLLDRLVSEGVVDRANRIAQSDRNIEKVLQRKLLSETPWERLRALRLAAELGLEQALTPGIQRSASDPNPAVRGSAVVLLGRVPGAGTSRRLRSAVDDPDDRVQANAIEALDRLDVAERIGCTLTKLRSPNARVRANAVKSLLRTESQEAAEVLIDMMDDTATGHRLSAVWVVGRLRLNSAAERVERLSRSDASRRVRAAAREALQRLRNADAGRMSMRKTSPQTAASPVPGGFR